MAKRFYDAVQPVALDNGRYAIMLDQYEVKTPARADLHLPHQALADMIAAEWAAQDEQVKPDTMPIMRLVSTALDRVAADPLATAHAFAAYGETDLLCYRAEHPDRLVERQTASWNPMLDWARARYDVSFATAQGILPVAQPQATLARLVEIAGTDALWLTGLAHGAALLGSAVLTLALADGEIDAKQAYELAFLDDLFQIDEWGEDAEAMARLDKISLEINVLAGYFSAQAGENGASDRMTQ
ncbi:MAG: ATP12 family protein [Rhodobiaceae bacterium]|jgi:chaperone required for assembly of F1-ATPase